LPLALNAGTKAFEQTVEAVGPQGAAARDTARQDLVAGAATAKKQSGIREFDPPEAAVRVAGDERARGSSTTEPMSRRAAPPPALGTVEAIDWPQWQPADEFGSADGHHTTARKSGRNTV